MDKGIPKTGFSKELKDKSTKARAIVRQAVRALRISDPGLSGLLAAMEEELDLFIIPLAELQSKVNSRIEAEVDDSVHMVRDKLAIMNRENSGLRNEIWENSQTISKLTQKLSFKLTERNLEIWLMVRREMPIKIVAKEFRLSPTRVQQICRNIDSRVKGNDPRG